MSNFHKKMTEKNTSKWKKNYNLIVVILRPGLNTNVRHLNKSEHSKTQKLIFLYIYHTFPNMYDTNIAQFSKHYSNLILSLWLFLEEPWPNSTGSVDSFTQYVCKDEYHTTVSTHCHSCNFLVSFQFSKRIYRGQK